MMIVRLGFVAEASAAHDWVVLKVLLPQEIGSLTSPSPITVPAYSREPYLAAMVFRTAIERGGFSNCCDSTKP